MNELQIYCAATRLSNEQREEFIQAACVKNPELLQRVRALFDAKTKGGEQPPSATPQAAGKNIIARTKDEVLIGYFANTQILDAAKINEIGTELLSLIQHCPGRKLVLNFHAVTYMSSAFLGKIINLHTECIKAQIDLRLCEIAPNLLKVFELMKLTKVLHIHPTEQKAIAAFDKHGIFGLRK